MKKLLMAAGLATGLTGCATIINGKTQTVNVVTTPPGAQVHIKSEDGSFETTAVTPAMVTLPRGTPYFHGYDFTVDVVKDGYAAQSDQLTHHVSGWYAGGNLLFGGLLGYLVVDPLTGSMWKLDKDTVSFQLQPAGNAQATSSALPVAAGTTASAPAGSTQLAADTSKLKLGTWSYEVHEMAKAAGCEGDGAWLITPASTVQEAYREVCPKGGTFTAVCDSVHCVRQ
jgi:hypothetical protein